MRKPNAAKAAPEAQDLRQRAARARDAAGRFIKRRATAESSSAVPDPARAAIEAHRSAFVEYERLASVANDLPPTDPAYRAASLAAEEPGRREIATYEALFRAKPTTLDGTLSLAAYLCDAVRTAQIDDKPSDGERALRTITEALQGLGPIHEHPDAALFALGAEFMAAWGAEEANGDEPEYQACSRIAEKIVRTPAATVAGYGIKALLLARLDSDSSGPHNPIEAHGPPDSWWNALRQVQQGAARLAAAPDMEIPMPAPTGPETGSPVTGGSIEGRLPAPAHDLSALSIVELARLYPVVVRVEEVMGSAECAPCFLDESQMQRTPAGRIINREADRLSQFTSAIAREMGRRRPADDDEAEERANTLLSHMVLSGGVAEHRELIAEINATWGA
jgi:hypothetical protein